MEWIKIDPNKVDAIPNENVWVFHITKQKVLFAPKGEWLALNTYSHYMIQQIPEPPKD